MLDKSKRRRVWSYGSSTMISTVVFLAILVFVVMIAERHPWRVDLTETGVFTLTEQTRKVLKSLDKPVGIKAFFQTASPEQNKAKDLLDTYTYFSKQLSYEFVDPDRQPEVARRYEVKAYGALVLDGYGKQQTIQTADEDGLTNAILKLTRTEEKGIYFLIGHGEKSIDDAQKDGYSNVRSALEKENHSVKELNLLQQDKVPGDAAVVIVAGPKKPLFPNEIESLKAYADGGGKLMVFLDPNVDGGLRDFLKNYGIELKDDIVIDKLSRVFGGSYTMPVVMEYGPQKITANFEVATFYPEARSVRQIKDVPPNVHVTVLASTSDNAWSETDMALLAQGQAGFDEKADIAGPVPLVVLSELDVPGPKEEKAANPSGEEQGEKERKAETGQGRKGFVLAAGDSDFVSNTHFGLSGNGDLFLNMVNFMAEEENLITIEARKKTGRPLLLTQSQAGMFFWTCLVLVPLLVLMTGLGVYRVRRSQR
jgi:ABC-type uncharacterized transport system involved in gliding motility auxiliary subunit